MFLLDFLLSIFIFKHSLGDSFHSENEFPAPIQFSGKKKEYPGASKSAPSVPQRTYDRPTPAVPEHKTSVPRPTPATHEHKQPPPVPEHKQAPAVPQRTYDRPAPATPSASHGPIPKSNFPKKAPPPPPPKGPKPQIRRAPAPK